LINANKKTHEEKSRLVKSHNGQYIATLPRVNAAQKLGRKTRGKKQENPSAIAQSVIGDDVGIDR
jgi:hypothetical protein